MTSALRVMGLSDDLSFAWYHHVLSRAVSQPLEDRPYPAPAQCVQQTLNAVVERLLLLNRVVEHLAKADAGGKGRVFKNARFLNTC